MLAPSARTPAEGCENCLPGSITPLSLCCSNWKPDSGKRFSLNTSPAVRSRARLQLHETVLLVLQLPSGRGHKTISSTTLAAQMDRSSLPMSPCIPASASLIGRATLEVDGAVRAVSLRSLWFFWSAIPTPAPGNAPKCLRYAFNLPYCPLIPHGQYRQPNNPLACSSL